MAKNGYVNQIEKGTRENSDFRRVLYTGSHSQLVLMSLEPGEEIMGEVHRTIDRFFRFEAGQGEVAINGTKHKVRDGDAVIVPAGAMHNVINTGKTKLKPYTVYSPPEHMDKVVRRTKARALAGEEEFDGKPTEWAERDFLGHVFLPDALLERFCLLPEVNRPLKIERFRSFPHP